jgi:hypothetical protein
MVVKIRLNSEQSSGGRSSTARATLPEMGHPFGAVLAVAAILGSEAASPYAAFSYGVARNGMQNCIWGAL